MSAVENGAGGDDRDLSPPYMLALALDAAGASFHRIAAVLAIPVESVPLLLDLARRKLGRKESH